MWSWNPFDWQKLRLAELLEDVSAAEKATARTDAGKHPDPVIPGLAYTEQQYEWVVLYNHTKHGQIEPSKLRRMRDVDLEFLAGSSHEGLGADEAAKVGANITRSTRELQRRYASRTAGAVAVFAAIVTVMAAVL